MQSFTKLTGGVAPMDRVDVDTDQIIPAEFLKRIERTGFGQFMFYKWRSREHAPWALLDYGFQCITAPSFADIFTSNSLQNGILLVKLPDATVRLIMDKAQANPGYSLHVDLESQRVWDDDEEVVAEFDIDEFAKYKLLNGLDDIGLTLQHEDKIAEFEMAHGM
jgi:3-isopropylmalate/(R)-2-methylmalate dehydratase small subunit